MNETLRKVLFGVIAVVIIALGIWASVGGQGDPEPVAEAPAPVETVDPLTPSPAETEDVETAQTPEVSLPMTQKDVEAAAAVAQDFLIASSSFDSKVPPADHLADLRRYVSSDALFEVDTLVPDGPAREEMLAEKVRITSDVRFDKVAFITSEQVSFIVKIETTTTGGEDAGTAANAATITVERDGSGWEIFDVTFGDDFEVS